MGRNNKKEDILSQYDKNENLYNDFLKYFHHIVTGILNSKQIVYQRVDTRLKERRSLEKKIELKNKYKEIEDITDICGMRIITYFSDDVDKIAKLFTSLFKIDEINSVDKREADDPTKFGYVSLHYIVSLNEDRTKLVEAERYKNLKIEIQIRTILQHAWAEIEHDLGYKTAGDIPADIRRKFSRLAGQIELADDEFVRIKDSMESYLQDTSNKIKSNKVEVPIDMISVKAFITSDEDYLEKLSTIRKLNIRMRPSLGEGELVNRHISHIVTMCASLDIKTIFELKNILNKYFDKLYQVLEHYPPFAIQQYTPLERILRQLDILNDKDIDENIFLKMSVKSREELRKIHASRENN